MNLGRTISTTRKTPGRIFHRAKGNIRFFLRNSEDSCADDNFSVTSGKIKINRAGVTPGFINENSDLSQAFSRITYQMSHEL